MADKSAMATFQSRVSLERMMQAIPRATKEETMSQVLHLLWQRREAGRSALSMPESGDKEQFIVYVQQINAQIIDLLMLY